MTETPRKPPIVIDPKMIDALLSKRDALLSERAGLRAKQAALAVRDREIDRELADCQAAGRVFNIQVDLPADETDDTRRLYFNIKGGVGKTLSSAALSAALDVLKRPVPSASSDQLPLLTPASAEMPRISDIVLDRLKAAGPKGSKAAPIQAYIESTYRKKIHEKTVGMTLYRLAKEGLVRRDGHTWFVVPETTNPGVAAPGPSKSAT